MEGLEASIVSKGYLARATSTLRLDPEYFQKQHLHDEGQIALRKAVFSSAKELNISVDASAFYPSIEEFYGSGEFPFYRVGDVDGIIDEARALRIPAGLCAQFPTLKQVEAGDILFTKGGAIDRAGYVKSAGAVSRDLIFLDTHRLPERNRLCLFAYFRTDLFRRMLTRSSSQTAQPHLTITLVRELPLFVGSDALGNAVSRVIERAYAHLDDAKHSVSDAEASLLAALGLANWAPPEPLAYTARASDVFASSRFDAQYFMPAKEQVKQSLAAVPGQLLADRVDSIRDQWLPDRAPGTMRVRNYDVTDALMPLLDAEKEPSFATDIGSMKKVFKDGDVAISRLRAYLKEVAVVRKGDDIPLVGSSEFIVLRPKGKAISPETLMVFLRSAPVQTILKWCQDGSQHPRFSEGDLLSIPVPDAVATVSDQITQIVQDGFAARLCANKLLEAAKRTVEIAIDDGEPAAMAYLDQAEGAI